MCSYTDYLLLVTGASSTHLRAMSEKFVTDLKQEGVYPLGKEGEQSSGWMLIDYGDVVAHLFLEETRDYYSLGRLWGDAPRLEWQQAKAATG